ncbi:MAG: thiamine-phosphate kinase [Synechococcus sp.]
MADTLQSLGEAELIHRLAQFAPAGQFDDDTATLPTSSQRQVINTDLLVEGVHFSEATTSAEDVGWRAAAVNLSDLAASGADTVVGLTVGLVAPGETPWPWVEGVYRGLQLALNRYGGVLLGGDCSSGHQRMVAITAIGSLGPLRLLRSAARAGDWLVTSGPHGLSRLGLALLQHDPCLNNLSLDADLCAAATLHHQRPTPRLMALTSLIASKPAHLPWRAGGTDSSDGLLQALKALSATSDCCIQLDPTALPQHPCWPKTATFQEWCLNGGEDFELVLSLPPPWAQTWLNREPNSCRIGEVIAGPAAVLWSDTQRPVEGHNGFAHFGR